MLRTWSGNNNITARDGALYEYSLIDDDVFILVQRDLPAIWHLEIRDGKPFLDHQYYLNINKKMTWI